MAPARAASKQLLRPGRCSPIIGDHQPSSTQQIPNRTGCICKALILFAEEPFCFPFVLFLPVLLRVHRTPDPATMASDIRAKALQKIASLSAASSTTSFDRSDLDKLCRACHAGGRGREYAHGGYSAKQAGSLGRVPMVSVNAFPGACASGARA